MAAAPPREAAAEAIPLFGHRDPQDVVARRRGAPITAARFAADIAHVAAELPEARHVLNACGDRYRFAVLLFAAACRGQLTLLPPTTTPGALRALREFAADVYCVADDPACDLELPRRPFPESAGPVPNDYRVPSIAADRALACVFTSGSTGEPRPNPKHWGNLALNVRNEAKRLGVERGHAVLGTVPPQHMYGFESTVLMPLVAGAALTAERLYYPADIDAALVRTPGPRVLFTTPFHLRTWIDSGPPAKVETLVSATAPLSPALAREAEEATGARLLEIYGCTEAGQVATRRPTLSPEWHAFDGIRLWNDERGQAHCQGAHVEAATALMDVIEPLGDGTRFKLHGRTADLVNIAGKRSSLGYLNHQLLAIPGVRDGTFFLPDDEPDDGIARLTAFVVAPGLTAAQVTVALRDILDPAFLPRPVVMVEALPRNTTGKVTREALRALAAAARP